ncbi:MULTISPECIES: hypothetical protein [Bacillaceae]|uniref:hypothetical protein n=1 Tax=Bacillaceae TaxID=186817 RepID=UPI002FFE5DFB
MKTPNHHDFYPKELVPIGVNDLCSLKKADDYSPSLAASHWLIAVEGVQLPQAMIYYHWKVSIYPADKEGDFDWKKPYFCSANMEKMDDAISLASTLYDLSKLDHLASTTKLERIS